GRSDSTETTIPPSPLPRSLSADTLRPPPPVDEAPPEEESTIDPARASTDESQAIDSDSARTVQMENVAAARAELRAREQSQSQSQSRPLVVAVETSAQEAAAAAAEEPPQPPPASTTAKIPHVRSDAADRRLAHAVLGIALILLSLAIVLW